MPVVGWGRAKNPPRRPLITRNLDATCTLCEELKIKGEGTHALRSGPLFKCVHKAVEQPAMTEEELAKLRQVTVLSKEDWDRIEDQLNYENLQKERIAKIQAERDRQKKRSSEIVGSWGNTIAALRVKKLHARAEREKREEEERTAVDLDWARQMAEERKEAIENAKREQYYQTDRVKKFHGALLLTEVMKEREAQLELKRQLEANARDNEAAYQKEVKEGIRLAEEADELKNSERKRAVKYARDYLMNQIEERKRKTEEAMEVERKEGIQFRKLATEDEAEHKKRDAMHKEERRQLQLQNMTQIEDCRRMRELERMQIEEEDEESRNFAAAKRRMLQMRYEKEKSMRNEKLAALEAIRLKIEVGMKKKACDEDERIRHAQEEKEAKRQEEEKEKEERTKVRLREFFEHRQTQMQRKEQRLQEEAQLEEETLRIRREADERYIRKETEKQVRRKKEILELAEYRKQQAAERYSKEEAAFKEELALGKADVELIENEEKMFQRYAQKVISKCEERGRNTYPLRKESLPGVGGGHGPVYVNKGHIRPSYQSTDEASIQLPCYQRRSTQEVKANVEGRADTKKRLGFVL